jgi:benzoylformate decarboxylase
VLRANQITRTSPQGPVYVCLESEMQETQLDREVLVPDVSRFQAPEPPAATADVLARLIALLKGAKAPILLFGRMSRDQGDWDRRVKLAELLGATVMTSVQNASCFPTEHPLHPLAPTGEGAAPAEGALIAKSDLLVSFDWYDLGGFLGGRSGKYQAQVPVPATVVNCSLDGYLANGWAQDHQALAAVDLSILADPDRLVTQLLEALEGQSWSKPAPLVAEAEHWASKAPLGPEPGAPFNAEQVGFTLSAFARTRPVTFPRMSFGWPRSACRSRTPLDYLGKDLGGAVGTGPGHTIGAALALKGSDRMVISTLGDGDFLMGNNALWTASRMNIPMLIVVVNNRSYFNDEVHQETMAKMRGRPVENKWIGQRIDDPPPDISGIARSFGFETSTPVRSVAELQAEIEKGAKVVEAGGRYLIDAQVIPGYSKR